MVLKKLVTVKFCALAFPPPHYGLKEKSQIVILKFAVYKSLNFLSTGVRAPFNYFISDQNIPPFNFFPLVSSASLFLGSSSGLQEQSLRVSPRGRSPGARTATATWAGPRRTWCSWASQDLLAPAEAQCLLAGLCSDLNQTEDF